MKNIAFLICCAGILSIFLDKSFAEGSPVLSGNTPAGQRDAAVLSDGEYMLTVNDYKELKEKGGLLVRYPARQKKLWEGVTFYFENRRDEYMVDAAFRETVRIEIIECSVGCIAEVTLFV